MNKILKLFSIIVGIIILVIILAIGLLITFVKPNQFKPMIAEQVKKYTGRDLIIDGDITWSFFPFVGIKTGHMVLGNPAGFNEKVFAEINQGTVSIALTPLLQGKIRSNGIVLNGMQLNLIKNAAGQPNWLFQSGTTPAKTLPTENKPYTSKNTSFNFRISTIDVSDVNVTYIDEQAHISYQVKNLELHAKNINLIEPFPLKLTLDFAAPSIKRTGTLNLTANIALNQNKQIYSLRDTELLISSTQKNKKINAKITGDIIANLSEQTLQWTQLAVQIANISIHGNMNIMNLISHPSIKGQIHIDPFDLKKALRDLGQDNDSLQTANNVSGDLSFGNSQNTVTAQGTIRMPDIQAANLKMKQVNIPVVLQNNVLSLSPITANLYDGSLSSQVKINLNSALPQIAAQTTLKNIQSGPLLEDLNGKNQKLKLTGTANFDMQITTSGNESKSIINHLNGTSHFSFDNGSLIGIDLGYLVDSAYALIKKQPMPSDNQNKTTFGNLNGSAIIQNGVISNQDLVLDSPRFATKGSGMIDLVNQKIKYTLEVTLKNPSNTQQNNTSDLFGIPLPILINGNLADPSIRLDSSALVKSIAAQELQKATTKAQEKLQEKIKQQVPGQAGELLQNLLGH